jgi:hypothetical protein
MNDRPFLDPLQEKFYNDPIFWVIVILFLAMVGGVIYMWCKYPK